MNKLVVVVLFLVSSFTSAKEVVLYSRNQNLNTINFIDEISNTAEIVSYILPKNSNYNSEEKKLRLVDCQKTVLINLLKILVLTSKIKPYSKSKDELEDYSKQACNINVNSEVFYEHSSQKIERVKSVIQLSALDRVYKGEVEFQNLEGTISCVFKPMEIHQVKGKAALCSYDNSVLKDVCDASKDKKCQSTKNIIPSKLQELRKLVYENKISDEECRESAVGILNEEGKKMLVCSHGL